MFTTTDLWYLSRGSGLVLLVVLTLVLALGVVGAERRSPFGWPRFVTQGLHRNLSLVAVGLLAVHVLSAELDPYTVLGWLALVVPFLSPYRTLWMGLGTLGVDLLAAVTMTSLARPLVGYRAWRAIHWLAYLSWPVALLHSLYSGDDTRLGWFFAVAMACSGVVVLAALVRVWDLLGSPRGGLLEAAPVTAPPPAPRSFSSGGPERLRAPRRSSGERSS